MACPRWRSSRSTLPQKTSSTGRKNNPCWYLIIQLWQHSPFLVETNMIRWRLKVAFEGVEAHIGLALQQKTRIHHVTVKQPREFLIDAISLHRPRGSVGGSVSKVFRFRRQLSHLPSLFIQSRVFILLLTNVLPNKIAFTSSSSIYQDIQYAESFKYHPN